MFCFHAADRYQRIWIFLCLLFVLIKFCTICSDWSQQKNSLRMTKHTYVIVWRAHRCSNLLYNNYRLNFSCFFSLEHFRLLSRFNRVIDPCCRVDVDINTNVDCGRFILTFLWWSSKIDCADEHSCQTSTVLRDYAIIQCATNYEIAQAKGLPVCPGAPPRGGSAVDVHPTFARGCSRDSVMGNCKN